MAVFRWYKARLITLQNKVDTTNNGYRYLVYRLLISVDIPVIKASLKDRITSKVQTANHRVSTRLRYNPRTAIYIRVHISSELERPTGDEEDE